MNDPPEDFELARELRGYTQVQAVPLTGEMSFVYRSVGPMQVWMARLSRL